MCSNYVATKVHENQIKSLHNLEQSLEQTIIVPHRIIDYHSSGIVKKERIKYVFKYFNLNLLKYFPILKCLTIFFWLLIYHKDEIKKSDVIYSHTLWTDGVPGYLLSLLFKKRFIVTVRSADSSLFLPKLIHYRWLIKMVAAASEKIIFVSPAYMKKITITYPRIFSLSKCKVISNALDSFWFKQHFDKKRSSTILFVGRFCHNKQLNILYQVILDAKDKHQELKFIAVGGTSEAFKSICSINDVPNWVEIIEYTHSREELARLYSESALMALPSINETFGLVYLEALSQGCPVIHLIGEGIDDIFPNNENVISIEYKNPRALFGAIDNTLNFNHVNINNSGILKVQSEIAKSYSWDSIATKIFDVIKG
jgi:glycosyltransferase involved in cell wall biosynthesis